MPHNLFGGFLLVLYLTQHLHILFVFPPLLGWQRVHLPRSDHGVQNHLPVRISGMHEELHVLLQAVIAAVLGGLLGWERESAGKWAGLRTHMLVALASVLLIRLGQILIGHTEETNRDMIQADPSRIIEAIVTAIAFLGAGTILKDSQSNKPRGLTTAASLLMTATIGIAVALDLYIIAGGVTLMCFTVLRWLNHLEKKIPSPPEKAP